MAWYRSGTVTTANGSPTVTGAGTDFVSNTTAGEVFLGPDGRVYEIAQVVSATQLTVIPNYQGASAGGQAYGIQPTQSFVRDLALNAATLLNTFGAVRDGIGQGMIGDGVLTAPSLRFAADQDTGLRRSGSNEMSLVTAGVDRVQVTADGHVQFSGLQKSVAYSAAERFLIGGQSIAQYGLTLGVVLPDSPNVVTVLSGYQALLLASGGAERARIDTSGNLLVGMASGNFHRLCKTTGRNPDGTVLAIEGSTVSAVYYEAGTGDLGNANPAAARLARHVNTGRSMNAGGTINASGADYAEYMTKSAGCGTIAAGDVCGVDVDGKLTRTWVDAVSFVVKSTDPAYVGGDSWAAHLPEKPEAPGAEPSPPIAPDAPPEIEDETALAAWRRAAAAYSAQMAAYPSARAAWQAATDAHARDLAAWDAALEAARVNVDRIAFCGQVPVNVTGDFAVGDYLIAAAAGAGIKAVAVAEADITFDQYRRRLGKVWAVRDGRAWVDVQHG